MVVNLSTTQVFLPLLTEYSPSALASELDASSCLSLGFHSDRLVCSSCSALAPFGLQPLQSDCLRCCKEDELGGLEEGAGGAGAKYPAALLEVCG